MGTQPESSPGSAAYSATIYSFETSDPVQGGIGGIDNQPLLELANRTQFLKNRVDGLVIGTNVQAWDADLDAIAAITDTNVYIRRSASNTWATVKADIGARCYRTTGQSIPNGTSTAIAFNLERYDTDDIHDNATNPSRLVCKTAGKYIIGGHLTFSGNTAGLREIRIRRNGSTLIAVHREGGVNSSGPTHSLSVSTIFNLAVSDYVELEAFQSSGSSLSIELEADYSPEFWMQRLL